MSNLLNKASIITTPTAYSDGSLHSVKPVQTFGSELVENGDFATNSYWNLFGDTVIENGVCKIINQGSNANSGFNKSGLTTIGAKYNITFDVVSLTSGKLLIEKTTGQTISTITTAGTYSINYTATTTIIQFRRNFADGDFNFVIDNVSLKEVIDADFDFTRGSSAQRENSSDNIESVAANLPRIDYLGGTAHILLEPQSTNHSLNSEQPSTWHSSGNMTVTANSINSPQGTQNASLAVVNGTSGAVYTRNLCNLPSGSGTQTITVGYFVKYFNNQWVRLRSNFFSGSPANGKRSFFDIQNGVLGTVDSNHTAKIENYGNGWFRCSITFDIDKDTDTSGYVHLEPMTNNDTNTHAAIGQGYYAFGSQCEELSFATSYIPTEGSTVTRLADECNNAGSSDLISSTEGVLYAEIAALANDGTVRYLALSDGTQNNRVTILYYGLENRIRAIVSSGGTNSMDKNFIVTSVLDFHKIAVVFKENDFSLWIDGFERRTDTSGLTPTGLDTLEFRLGGANNFFGKVKCVAVFKEALSDTELQKLTTI